MHPAKEAEPPPLPPVEHVRRLVEANRVAEARRYVEEQIARGDMSVETWANLLRPPRVTTSPRTAHSDFGADYAWLRANREAFLGLWVALRDGRLLDSDVRLRPLVERLTARGELAGAFVVQVD
jgi:hypothetical protein